MNVRALRVLAAMVLAAATAVAAEPTTLSPQEREIARAVEAQLEEAVGTLERLVAMDSATENVEGVREVGRVFEQELKALGFTTRWVDLPPEMKRAGHLFAEREGTRGKRVLLIGHLDTVLPGGKVRREGSKVFGSGAADMKGGDVIILYALKALHRVGALEGTRLRVALTGDEEEPGEPHSISRKDLVEAGRTSDVALAFEGAIRNTATVARRGTSSWRLEVTGRPGHSSGIFSERLGSGAIFEAARILQAFHEQLRGERYLTFNPGLIVGGSQAQLDEFRGEVQGKTNVVAGKVLVEGEIRFISEEQLARARERMRRIVARHLPGTSASIEFKDSYPAMAPRPESLALLKQLDQVSRALGAGPMEALDPSARGAGDISFVASYVPGLDGLGAKGEGAHAEGEYADLEALKVQIQRTAVLLHRLTR